MKRILCVFLALIMALPFAGCSDVPGSAESIVPEQEESVQEEAVEELPVFTEIQTSVRKKLSPDGIGEITPYGDYWFNGKNYISEDLSGHKDLAYTLTVSDATEFAYGEPDGYDKDNLIEWGKDPGLNVDVLHDLGYTGKGAVIAYVDQPISGHEQYDDLDLTYINNTDSNTSMHGPAVLSLLAGKDIGTAPEAKVYFYAHASWYADQETHAECLYQIIELNKNLPDDEKITMVGFSDNIDSSEKNAEALKKAVKAAEEAGIMVWFCAEYDSGSFVPMSNKNDPDNVVYAFGSGNVVVPTAGRTTSATYEKIDYIYWAEGGLSWAMPYVLGLYAIAGEIDPDITKDELYNTLSSTATVNVNGVKVINPTGFIAEILRKVGKNSEAEILLKEVQNRTKYLYAVVNTDQMTEEDISAIDNHLSEITNAKVIKVDARDFNTAEELYTSLKNDIETRGGIVEGIQIFGNSDVVPSFSIQYKVDMVSSVDEGGFFKTDLFYGNFENDADDFANYNVMDHFENDLDVEIVPQWQVARLPLAKGEFSSFMKKYSDFEEETDLTRLDIVNFSNPIFQSSKSSDNMGVFLNRAKKEFGILNIDYRLYGNLDGDYPVSNDVIGNFTAENLSLENENGIYEFIINSHGQSDNVDRCIFENGEEIRESLMNVSNINTILDDNYYYLDMWTCLNGYDMKNNLTTTALNGKCVGVFSATTIISNNGANCRADVSELPNSNFYYFYYNYLKALDAGESRSRAFFNAQKAYGEALLKESENPIEPGSNYQFNVCNLFAYHNFGIIEDSSLLENANISYDYDVKETPQKNDQSSKPANNKPSSNSSISYNMEHGEDVLKFHSITKEKSENGSCIITVDFETGKKLNYSCFNPPQGTVFMYTGKTESSGRQTLVFEITAEQLESAESVTIMFYDEEKRSFAHFKLN